MSATGASAIGAADALGTSATLAGTATSTADTATDDALDGVTGSGGAGAELSAVDAAGALASPDTCGGADVERYTHPAPTGGAAAGAASNEGRGRFG